MQGENTYLADKERLLANFVWLNRFFQDVSSLLYRTAKLLEPTTGASSARFYYPKSLYTPGIPDYWLMGITGTTQSVQIFVILKPEILERDCFIKEPSFVVFHYDRPIDSLQIAAYAQRIFEMDQAIQMSIHPDHILGAFPGEDVNRLHFQGFQIKLDPFINVSDVEQVVRREFIDRLNQLQSWDSPHKAS